MYWWRSRRTQRNHLHHILCVGIIHAAPDYLWGQAREKYPDISKLFIEMKDILIHQKKKLINLKLCKTQFFWKIRSLAHISQALPVYPDEMNLKLIFCRLPIIQGATFSFLTPTFTILALKKWECPFTLAAKGTPVYKKNFKIIINLHFYYALKKNTVIMVIQLPENVKFLLSLGFCILEVN